MDAVRVCKTCGQTKPLTEEHWRKYNRRDGSRKGWRSPCRVCERASQREQKRREYAAKPEMRKARSQAWREANPEKHKAMLKKWYDENQEYAREQARKWRIANPERKREQGRAWRLANLDKVREMQRRWRAANPEKVRQWLQAWRDANREHVRAKDRLRIQANPEKHRANTIRWRLANPNAARAQMHKRRALLLAAEGSHTQHDITRIYNDQNGKCAYCGVDLNGIYDVDHIMPISRGGSNAPENLACACVRCNLSKSNKTVEEWRAMRGW